jgi:hypothetical protein
MATEITIPKVYAEHIQKVLCHEIHRIRWRLSGPWLPSGEKDALESELWSLTDTEDLINDQL